MKIVKQGQSFLDKTTQLTGSFENALEIAVLNGLSITDDVVIGLVVEPSEVTNKRVVASYNEFNEPATNISQSEIEALETIGIGIMVIEDTFIVK
ncbi:hypothetical protein N9609_00665 [bacterium]|nr:hypothetical protein [bacterium]